MRRSSRKYATAELLEKAERALEKTSEEALEKIRADTQAKDRV